MSECPCPTCRNIGPDWEADRHARDLPPIRPNKPATGLVATWLRNPHLTHNQARELHEKQARQ